jgi:hypothetical protein
MELVERGINDVFTVEPYDLGEGGRQSTRLGVCGARAAPGIALGAKPPWGEKGTASALALQDSEL